MAIVPFGRALYYPYINFKDLNWLKFAALYYDGIDRIVPSDDLVEEISLIEALNDQSDNTPFVRNINPAQYADAIAEDFVTYLKEELTDTEKKQKVYNKLSGLVSPTDTYPIHINKMGEYLLHELPHLGLSVNQVSYEFENWYEFDAVTGSIYMSRLANHIASKKSLPLVSDDANFQAIVRAAQKDRFSVDIGQALASIVIETAVPQNLESIPIKKIIKFRKDYRDERQTFYDEVNKLVKDLYQIEDEQSLKDALHSKKQHIERSVNNIDKVFKGIKISTGTALLSLSIPSFASGLGWAIAAGGIISIAAGKLITQGIEYNKTKNNSPHSYILSLRKDLAIDSFAEQLLKGKLVF